MKKFCYFFLFFISVVSIYGQKSPFASGSKEINSNPKEVFFQQLIDSSTIYYNNGEYRKDLTINFELLKLAFEIDNPSHIYKGFRNLGYDYLILGDTILAKESFEKSEKQALILKNDTLTALSYMDLANIYSISSDNIDKAIIYHDKSIALFEKLQDSTSLAKAHYNTVLTALENEDYNRAYIHIIKAKKFINYGDPTYEVDLEILQGQYHFLAGNRILANGYLTKAIKDGEKNGFEVALEDAYYYYSENLMAQENYKDALAARVKYEEYLDINQQKLISTEVEAASANHQVAEYKKEVKEAETQYQLQVEKVNNKSRLNTFLIIVFVCFSLLFFALYYAYRNRKALVQELKLKNKEYLKAKEESEKSSLAKSKFFSTVSHELRTPLYGVIGLSTILLEDKSLIKHENDLKSLKFSADYLLALINDVLQINKIDSNNIEDEQTDFNLRELTRKIAASFEYMRLQNKNKIHIHISEIIPEYLRGNSIRLSQILMNLLGNACKFTENGEIYLIAETVHRKGTDVAIKFYVKDNGIGIPNDKQELIFEEFSQANSVNYNYQGTGLGLPIVKKLLALSNSQIQLESDPGKGSIFSFELSFKAIDQVIKKKELAILDTNSLNGKKILIVEDNRINQIVTKKILEKNHVLCSLAENGNEAIQMVKESNYDLILMDINMPMKNGMEATKEIRLFNQIVPIIALTAVEVEEIRYQIYESGMNDIVVKPYDVTKFTQTILKNLDSIVPISEIHKGQLKAV